MSHLMTFSIEDMVKWLWKETGSAFVYTDQMFGVTEVPCLQFFQQRKQQTKTQDPQSQDMRGSSEKLLL